MEIQTSDRYGNEKNQDLQYQTLNLYYCPAVVLLDGGLINAFSANHQYGLRTLSYLQLASNKRTFGFVFCQLKCG